MPGLASLHHVALTVSDFERSIPWYEQVFGIKFFMDAPHEGGNGKLLADGDPPWNLIIVLHVHDASKGETFDERRTGLDHIGFQVESRAALDEWQRHLQNNGVELVDTADRPLTQSPIVDAPYGGILVFRDPDNIQLELFAAPAT